MCLPITPLVTKMIPSVTRYLVFNDHNKVLNSWKKPSSMKVTTRKVDKEIGGIVFRDSGERKTASYAFSQMASSGKKAEETGSNCGPTTQSNAASQYKEAPKKEEKSERMAGLPFQITLSTVEAAGKGEEVP